MRFFDYFRITPFLLFQAFFFSILLLSYGFAASADVIQSSWISLSAGQKSQNEPTRFHLKDDKTLLGYKSGHTSSYTIANKLNAVPKSAEILSGIKKSKNLENALLLVGRADTYKRILEKIGKGDGFSWYSVRRDSSSLIGVLFSNQDGLSVYVEVNKKDYSVDGFSTFSIGALDNRPFPLILAHSEKHSTQCVQNALNFMGYDVGSPDGIVGKKSRGALDSFLSEHEISADIDTLSSNTAFEWCRYVVSERPELAAAAEFAYLQLILDEQPKIFIVNGPAQFFKSLIEGKSREELVSVLYDIGLLDIGKDVPSESNLSIIYILSKPLQRNDKISTRWHYLVDGKKEFINDKTYEGLPIGDSGPPIVQITLSDAIWQGSSVFMLKKNGRTIASRSTQPMKGDSE